MTPDNNALSVMPANAAVQQLSALSQQVPTLVQNSGTTARERFVEYFIGQIRNPNTRRSYGLAVNQFLVWCEGVGLQKLEEVNFVAVSAYVEQHAGAPQTILQHLAAIRQLFAWLVEKRVLDRNPAENVRGPKHRVKVGKTPVLQAEEMRVLLDSFDLTHITGLRDQALICLMTYTFARISAVLAMNVEDSFMRGSRHYIQLLEKGGKPMDIPLHHTAAENLHLYIDAAQQQLGDAFVKGTPIFRSQKRGRARILSNRRLDRREALAMVKRRAKVAGIGDDTCNHTFRGTGITNYLENGGSRDIAQELAGHEDVRTTALYDRRGSKVSLDELERIRF